MESIGHFALLAPNGCWGLETDLESSSTSYRIYSLPHDAALKQRDPVYNKSSSSKASYVRRDMRR